MHLFFARRLSTLNLDMMPGLRCNDVSCDTRFHVRHRDGGNSKGTL